MGCLLNPTNVFWKDLMPYSPKLIMNSYQGLVPFRQKQILMSTSHKKLEKQNNVDFLIQLIYAWLHLANNNFPAHVDKNNYLPTHIFKLTH